MSDPVITRIIVFGWLTATAVAVFTWFSVSHWISARTAERKDRERNALLRHLAGQPVDSARLVLEKMREDEEQARKDAAAQFQCWADAQERERQRATPGARGGLLIIAVGVGLGIFLYAMRPAERVWTVSAIPVLVGAVVTAFALLGPRRSATSNAGSPSDRRL
jgi:hypothetical protein